MALPEQGMMRPVPLRARTSDLIITNLPGKYLDRSHLTGFIREINQTAPRQPPRLQLQVQTRPGPLPPGHQATSPAGRPGCDQPFLVSRHRVSTWVVSGNMSKPCTDCKVKPDLSSTGRSLFMAVSEQKIRLRAHGPGIFPV